LIPVPVDVVKRKSSVDSFLDPSGVPVRGWNKLYLVPQQIVSGLLGVLKTADYNVVTLLTIYNSVTVVLNEGMNYGSD